MLTYHGITNQEHWQRFLELVGESLGRWGVRHWCATLESCKDGKLHVHLYVQFARETVDVPSTIFEFEGVRPRVDSHDLLGEGLCGRKHQQSMDRGFFYVWAEKTSSVYDS